MRHLAGITAAAFALACSQTIPAGTTLTGGTIDARDTVVGRAYASARRAMSLQTRAGEHLLLGGALSADMLSLANVGASVEVRIVGRREAGAFDVADFEVLRVGGQAVDDGHVLVSGNHVMLVTRDRRQFEIAEPPTQLRYLVGSRIWLHRPPRAEPPFGIIVRK